MVANFLSGVLALQDRAPYCLKCPFKEEGRVAVDFDRWRFRILDLPESCLKLDGVLYCYDRIVLTGSLQGLELCARHDRLSLHP